MRGRNEIEERIALWEKVMDQSEPYRDRYPSKEVYEALGIEEGHLLSDEWYDGECAWWIIRELQWVLS